MNEGQTADQPGPSGSKGPPVVKKTIMLKSDTEKFLVGHPQVKVTGAELPTAGQTLRVFFHRQMCKEISCECQLPDMSKWTSLSDLAYLVVRENILPFWGKAGIPTMSLQYAKEKLLKLHSR